MNNLPPSTVYVVPGIEIVQGLLDRFELYASNEKKASHQLVRKMLDHRPLKGDTVQGINFKSVSALVYALYLDAIEQRSHWAALAGPSDAYERQMGKMIAGYSEAPMEFTARVFMDVVDEAEISVEESMRLIEAGGKTWNVWYVRQLGPSIMLEKGPDYRILDWERRMAAAAELIDGEDLPPEAWRPDGEARRFAQLMRKAQTTCTVTGFEASRQLDTTRIKSKPARVTRRR
ncbi:hypothetical protein LUCX_49 [Xanthomonas phage vB_XciM_LucasX]|nr:hypothetical protein LUCX_49 [Xanthomonas phage vB_XciM_LucasX]